MAVTQVRREGFRDVLAVGEFRTLLTALVLSVCGDQLARVALSVLVFDRTGSALLSATAYAASYVPYIIGGFLLAGLADRLPRREVMIACDIGRAALVGAMVVPGVPMWVLIALLAAATLLASPFASARATIYPDVLPGDRYVLGQALVQTTMNSGNVIGFAVGGVVVAAVGARFALGADTVSFLLSAVLLWYGLRRRPAAGGGRRSAPLADAVIGTRLAFGNRKLRTYMLFGWLIALYGVAEGLAAPYAASLGGGAVEVGLILAAGAFGMSIGGIAFTAVVAAPNRDRWIGPLAVLCCATIMACALRPGLVASLVIFAVGGAFGAYQIPANTAFVLAIPDGRRSQVFGIAHAGMLSLQGVVFVLAGTAADHVAPAVVIAVCGAIGTVLAVVLAIRHAPGHHRARTEPAPTR